MFERLVLKSGLRFSRLNFASYCVVKSCGKRVRRQSAQVERFLSTWDRYLSGWERYLSGWERYGLLAVAVVAMAFDISRFSWHRFESNVHNV